MVITTTTSHETERLGQTETRQRRKILCVSLLGDSRNVKNPFATLRSSGGNLPARGQKNSSLILRRVDEGSAFALVDAPRHSKIDNHCAMEGGDTPEPLREAQNRGSSNSSYCTCFISLRENKVACGGVVPDFTTCVVTHWEPRSPVCRTRHCARRPPSLSPPHVRIAISRWRMSFL